MNKARPKQPYPVQVRLSPDTREAIRGAADAAGRTLAKEMERRLEASLVDYNGQDPLYAGWPPDDAARFRSLANVVGILSARVALTYGYDSDTDAHILGALQPAIIELFKGLGAEKVDPENERFFAMIARQMLTEISQAPNVLRPDSEKAALAAFAKSWGVQSKKG